MSQSGIILNSNTLSFPWCNTTEEVIFGLHYQGSNVATVPVRNHMLNDLVGLLLNNGTINNLGSTGNPWDNQWDGTFVDTYAYNANASGNTIYYRSSGASTPFQPETNSASSLIYAFQTQSTSGSYADICGDNGVQGILPDSSIQAMMHISLNDTATLPRYHDELRWADRYNMFVLLNERDSLLLGDSLLTAFYDSCHASNMGKLYRAMKAQVGQEKPETLEVHLDTISNITTSIVPEKGLKDLLVVLLQKTLDTNTVVDSASWHVTALLNELFPDSSFVALRVKKRSYTSIQDSTLRHIAAQCPSEFGPAVFMARAMLGTVDTIPYMLSHECEMAEPPASERRGQEDENLNSGLGKTDLLVSVYPNPTNSTLTISITDADQDSKFAIRILDALGVEVLNRPLSMGLTHLSVEQLGSGAYFYRVFKNSEIVFSGKQIIIRP